MIMYPYLDAPTNAAPRWPRPPRACMCQPTSSRPNDRAWGDRAIACSRSPKSHRQPRGRAPSRRAAFANSRAKPWWIREDFAALRLASVTPNASRPRPAALHYRIGTAVRPCRPNAATPAARQRPTWIVHAKLPPSTPVDISLGSEPIPATTEDSRLDSDSIGKLRVDLL